MFKRPLLSFAVSLFVFVSPLFAADVFDDRGFAPHRDYFSQLPYEHIDPMTGNLLLTFTDLVLPGNAGLDLKIQRTYNSKIYRDYSSASSDAPDEDSWAGLGWTLHLGRVLNPRAAVPGPIEMPDGSRHRLYFRNDGSGQFITRDFWIYDTSQTDPVLRLPNGVTYTFGNTTTSTTAWYVTRIADPFANTIDVQYKSQPADGIDWIKQDLGGGQIRTVTFGLDGPLLDGLRTMTYSAGVRTYTWTYTQVASNNVGYSHLTAVKPPIGPSWQYGYHTAAPGPLNELVSMTSPQGGQIAYEYADQDFYLGNTLRIRSRVVSKRTVSGRGLPAGTWTYVYATGDYKNQSVITSPCDVTTYQFLGVGGAGVAGGAWRVGLMQMRSVSEIGASTPLETETLTWRATTAPISSAQEDIGANHDSAIFVALLDSRTVARPNRATLTTTFGYNDTNYNDYGRAKSGQETGELSRTTARTFQYGFSPAYIVDRMATETVTLGAESFIRSFVYNLANGFKTSETVHGITTSFAPTSTGNVASSTNANSHTTSFTYSWGRVAVTSPPLAAGDALYKIERLINPEGTVASEKRRGLTTALFYDDLFRLTRAVPPAGNPTDTTYDNVGAAATTVTRGPSSIVTTLDGFGRPVAAQDAEGVRTATSYNACGRQAYVSYPYTGSVDSGGSSFTYDALGRLKTKTNPDTTTVRYDYAGRDITITDENSHATVQTWSAFGDPGDARLVRVRDAAGAQTDYTYNALGSLTGVTLPGAVQRSWAYYSTTGLLHSETHPESGFVDYTHDAAGNMKTRTDSLGQTTYFYDANERLTSLDGPGTDYDTSVDYDASDNRTGLSNALVQGIFRYDGGNRLTSRTDTISGWGFTTSFTPDGNDIWPGSTTRLPVSCCTRSTQPTG